MLILTPHACNYCRRGHEAGSLQFNEAASEDAMFRCIETPVSIITHLVSTEWTVRHDDSPGLSTTVGFTISSCLKS